MKLGLSLAVLVLLLDRTSKQMILGLRDAAELPREVTSFFNLVLTWNRGITFGLFNNPDGPDYGRWVLVLVTAGISVALLVWLWLARGRLLVTGLGLVIGGAVGNLVDRVQYGAVVDFLDFHLLGYHWYAFNVADAAIVCGVGLLLLDSLMTPQKANK